MTLAPATYNSHRTNVAFAWELSIHVATMTPTAADTTDYAGTVYIYGPSGTEVASAAYSYTSDADATAAEIVSGLLADLTGSDVDDYVTLSGVDTAIITADSRGYTIAVVNDGPGVIATAYTGKTSEQGTTPADAAAWVAEGVRLFFEEADPAFITGQVAVENVDLEPRVFAKKKSHKGLPTADGGTLTGRLWSSGVTAHGTDVQVSETPLGKLLGHALGGTSRSEDTGVDAVTTQAAITLDDTTYIQVGDLIALEDASGNLWPAQVLTVDGADVTLDRVQSWTITTDTDVHGVESAYPEQSALTNALDPNYSTLSILYQIGQEHLWMAGGAHLALEGMAFERGAQPKVSFAVLAAAGYPQGAGAPTAPAWTGAPSSAADVEPVGHRTKCFLQAYGTTDSALVSLYSASLTPGVPVIGQDTVTEADDGMPGRLGYRTEPADTILELVVPLEDVHQTRWTAGTYVTCTYFQVSSKGACWAVHVPKAFLQGPPTASNDGTNRWTITLQATEPDTDDTTTEISKAKILIATY